MAALVIRIGPGFVKVLPDSESAEMARYRVEYAEATTGQLTVPDPSEPPGPTGREQSEPGK